MGSSDLDLLVVLAPGADILAIVELKGVLETRLGVTVDVLAPQVARPQVLERPRREAVTL